MQGARNSNSQLKLALRQPIFKAQQSTTSMTEYQATLSCIDKLLNDHAAHPFDVLRESGVQAELCSHLLGSFPERVSAEVTQPLSPGRFNWQQPILTKRVQLEMKICFPVDVKNKRADLVVLRKDVKVQLSCHGNGPGDIVATLRPEDVAVAIEVKASPSRDPDQCRKYVSDLERLLLLNRNCKIEGFFVLLDKSHSRFGSVSASNWISRSADQHDWKDLRKFLGNFNISTERPPQATASATMCYLTSEGSPAHVFVWE